MAEFLVEKPGTKTGLLPGFFVFSSRHLLSGNVQYFWLFASFSSRFLQFVSFSSCFEEGTRVSFCEKFSPSSFYSDFCIIVYTIHRYCTCFVIEIIRTRGTVLLRRKIKKSHWILYIHVFCTEFRIHEPTRNSVELNSKKFRGITWNKTNSV